jgi:hypothetical protein
MTHFSTDLHVRNEAADLSLRYNELSDRSDVVHFEAGTNLFQASLFVPQGMGKVLVHNLRCGLQDDELEVDELNDLSAMLADHGFDDESINRFFSLSTRAEQRAIRLLMLEDFDRDAIQMLVIHVHLRGEWT